MTIITTGFRMARIVSSRSRRARSPRRNLALQSAVIAGARAFVGTYGGYSYLAPLLPCSGAGVLFQAVVQAASPVRRAASVRPDRRRRTDAYRCRSGWHRTARVGCAVAGMRAILLTSTLQPSCVRREHGGGQLRSRWRVAGGKDAFGPSGTRAMRRTNLIIERHFADRDASEERYFSSATDSQNRSAAPSIGRCPLGRAAILRRLR